jgi:hypothetical protein
VKDVRKKRRSRATSFVGIRKVGIRSRVCCSAVSASSASVNVSGVFFLKGVRMKVNTENIPDEYKGIVKEEMSMAEIDKLGQIIVKQKIQKLKNRWHEFWHKKEWW